MRETENVPIFRIPWRVLRLILLALSAGLAAGPAYAQVPPPGWRFSLSSDWHVDPDRVSLEITRVRADFDGDGADDHAALLVSESAASGEHAVVAFRMLPNGGQQIQQLLKCATSCGEVALTVIRAGCFTSELTSATVCLEHPGFALLEIEFGSGTLYWYAQGAWQNLGFSRGELGDLL